MKQKLTCSAVIPQEHGILRKVNLVLGLWVLYELGMWPVGDSRSGLFVVGLPRFEELSLRALHFSPPHPSGSYVGMFVVLQLISTSWTPSAALLFSLPTPDSQPEVPSSLGMVWLWLACEAEFPGTFPRMFLKSQNHAKNDLVPW